MATLVPRHCGGEMMESGIWEGESPSQSSPSVPLPQPPALASLGECGGSWLQPTVLLVQLLCTIKRILDWNCVTQSGGAT